MPPFANRGRSADPAVNDVSNSTQDNTGPLMGHVILGVLGGIAVTIFLVVICVPLMRWRRRGGSLISKKTSGSDQQSRASSRRTHQRLPSIQDAVLPLLKGRMKTREGLQNVEMMAKDGVPVVLNVKDEQSRPPAASSRSWKILTTLPNFSEDTMSSLGRPLEPSERIFTDSYSRSDSRNAQSVLGEISPPASVHESPLALSPPPRRGTGSFDQSRSVTLISNNSAITSGSSLSYAAKGFSPSSQNTTPTSSTLYPSMAGSITLYSPPIMEEALPATVVETSRVARTTSEIKQSLQAPWDLTSHVPESTVTGYNLLVSSSLYPSQLEGRLRKGPMTPIAESIRSRISDTQQSNVEPSVDETMLDPPSPLAMGTSFHDKELSAGTSTSISSSNTALLYKHSRRASASASTSEPPGSAFTSHTFGRPMPPPVTVPEVPVSVSRSVSVATAATGANTVPFPTSPVSGILIYQTDGSNVQSRFSTGTSEGHESEEGRRASLSYAQEPSQALKHVPLSHPPIMSSLFRTNMPLRPLPEPERQRQFSEELEAENTGAELDPESEEGGSRENLLPALPDVRPISPFHFEFHFDSRRGTPTPGSDEVSRHSTVRSKASSRSKLSKKYSLSPSRSRSSSRSRTVSHDREASSSRRRLRSVRRVTFGVPSSPTDSPHGSPRSFVERALPALPSHPSLPIIPPIPPPPNLVLEESSTVSATPISSNHFLYDTHV